MVRTLGSHPSNTSSNLVGATWPNRKELVKNSGYQNSKDSRAVITPTDKTRKGMVSSSNLVGATWGIKEKHR